MIASTVPETARRMPRIRGFAMPAHDATGGKVVPFSHPYEVDLPHPAIEELPSFVKRIDSAELTHGVRHYNGSIAMHDGRIFMAYRVESYRAVSRVAVCELGEDFGVLRDALLEPAVPRPDTQIEDPHLASVGGKLMVVLSNVVRDFPSTCTQRVFTVCPQGLRIECEVEAPFGSGIEKNWTPFELPNGGLGLVYKQRPRMVIEVATKAGHTSPEVACGVEGSSLSGRTGPLRLPNGLFLEFVGGHVPIPGRATRKTRYWFGALLFEAKPPFRVVASTKEPLVWASEASPTTLGPLPGGGHPVCILPAGAIFEGDEKESVLVSCGVNDSYIAMLRFSVKELMGKMSASLTL